MTLKLAFSGVQMMAMANLAIYEDDFGDNPPSDDYVAEIYEMADHVSKTGGGGSVIVRARVVEGIKTGKEHAGKALTSWIGKTPASKGGIERNWKALMLSLGANPQSLEATFAPDPTIINQLLTAVNNPSARCYIAHRMPPTAEGGVVKAEDINNTFLQPATYQQRKAAAAGGGNASPSFGAPAPGFGGPAAGAPATGFQVTGTPPAMPAGAPNVTPQPPNGAPAGAAMFAMPPAGGAAPSFGPQS